MAIPHSGLTPPPHNPPDRRWPTYEAEGCTIPVSVYMMFGIQVPGMADSQGAFECGISGVRTRVSAGVGTLFLGSFDNEADAVPVSAAVMAMSHQLIRQMVIRHLLSETILIQRLLTQVLDTIYAGEWQLYLRLTHEAELMSALLHIRMNWMSGIIAIEGGNADPLVSHVQMPRRSR